MWFGREGRDQGGAHPAALEGQAGKARPKGPRRSLDGEVLQAKPAQDGSKRADIALPAFSWKNYLGIDRRHGLIRTWLATDAARHDGVQLPNLVSKANTASVITHGAAIDQRRHGRGSVTTVCLHGAAKADSVVA